MTLPLKATTQTVHTSNGHHVSGYLQYRPKYVTKIPLSTNKQQLLCI